MGKVKRLNIKNQTYYYFNDVINIKDFHSNLLRIDTKQYKGIDIYFIGYIIVKKIGDCENINIFLVEKLFIKLMTFTTFQG